MYEVTAPNWVADGKQASWLLSTNLNFVLYEIGFALFCMFCD